MYVYMRTEAAPRPFYNSNICGQWGPLEYLTTRIYTWTAPRREKIRKRLRDSILGCSLVEKIILDSYWMVLQRERMAGNLSEWLEEEEEDRERAVVCLVLSEMILAFLGE